MIINILQKNNFLDLVKYNDNIDIAMKDWNFNSEGKEYDFANRIISSWFNPKKVRKLGLSRIYPHHSSVQFRPEYRLYLHCSNYLGLFLIDLLYKGRKDILIEDIGGGMGWLFMYLNKLGFNHFHLWDNFSQVSKEAATEFITLENLNCAINQEQLNPVISNNVGVPAYFVRKVSPDLELIVFYTNRSLEQMAKEQMPKHNFKFLCRDSDDLAVAYCRTDKYDEYQKMILPFETSEVIQNDII